MRVKITWRRTLKGHLEQRETLDLRAWNQELIQRAVVAEVVEALRALASAERGDIVILVEQ